MKIAYLGAGAWGFCLALLLASKNNQVVIWTRDESLAKRLNNKEDHPFLPGRKAIENMYFTTDINEALDQAEVIVESVTSKGVRPVFEKIKSIKRIDCPIVLTSKGIEQKTGEITPEILMEILGSDIKPLISFLSGPSYAEEVSKGLPTSVVVAAYDFQLGKNISEIFTTPTFRVYPNSDIVGVAYGGALKNVIAIACGIADGLGMGYSTKATLMTRGLHEIRKLALAKGCKTETIYGLSGMGDLCVTCSSLISRNCRFGHLLAQGITPKEAQLKIGMVVEGAYTVVSALQLSKELGVSMPITEIIYKILYEDFPVKQAVQSLMERSIKEEHL